MRTTVDLPPAAHRRVRELAAARHQSMSAVIADFTLRGLAQPDQTPVVRTDPRSGFPVIDIGRTITAEEVADLIDEDE